MITLKNEKQINGIRKSCHELADLFNEIIPRVKPGVSTKEIDDWCVEFVRKFGMASGRISRLCMYKHKQSGYTRSSIKKENRQGRRHCIP